MSNLPMASDELTRTITGLVAPVAAAREIELIEVEVRGAAGSRVVKIVADAPDGLDIDVIAGMSRELGEPLDELIEGAYTLEVTSPGADRPLRSDRDFARNIGRDVRIQRTSEAAAEHGGDVTGTVNEVRDDIVLLDVDGTEVQVPVVDIEFGKVVLPW